MPPRVVGEREIHNARRNRRKCYRATSQPVTIVFKDIAIDERTEATLEFKRLAVAILPRIRSRITGTVLLRVIGRILRKGITDEKHILDDLCIKSLLPSSLEVHPVSGA